MPHVEMRDGRKLYVREIGIGHPVIILHGFGIDSAPLIPCVLPLMLKHKFILPDLRGFGKSAQIPFNKDSVFTNYYEDIEDIIAHYKMSSIPVVAFSMGALFMMYYLAHNKNDHIEKFLIVDQSPSFKDTDTHKFGIGLHNHHCWMKRCAAIIETVENDKTPNDFFKVRSEFRKYVIQFFSDFVSAAFPELYMKLSIAAFFKTPYLRNLALPSNNWAQWFQILKEYYQNEAYILNDQVHRIKTPTTIFVGLQSDMYPPESAYYLHQQIKNSKLVEFKKSGHALPFSEFRKFIKELGAFLDSH